MSEARVASRYAKALVGIAQEKNILENIYQDAEQFLSTCKNSRDLQVVLKNPIIPHDKKSNIVQRVFSKALSENTLNFIRLVIKKQRSSMLVPIFRKVVDLYKHIKGITSATVHSAITLSEDTQEKLKKFVKGEHIQQVEMQNIVNKDLLGGFLLQYEDKLLDKSVATQLKDLRKALKN